MSQKIPTAIRKAVALRANYCCEYCRLATIKILTINHPDRIIERKLLLQLGLLN